MVLEPGVEDVKLAFEKEQRKRTEGRSSQEKVTLKRPISIFLCLETEQSLAFFHKRVAPIQFADKKGEPSSVCHECNQNKHSFI